MLRMLLSMTRRVSVAGTLLWKNLRTCLDLLTPEEEKRDDNNDAGDDRVVPADDGNNKSSNLLFGSCSSAVVSFSSLVLTSSFKRKVLASNIPLSPPNPFFGGKEGKVINGEQNDDDGAVTSPLLFSQKFHIKSHAHHQL